MAVLQRRQHTGQLLLLCLAPNSVYWKIYQHIILSSMDAVCRLNILLTIQAEDTEYLTEYLAVVNNDRFHGIVLGL